MSGFVLSLREPPGVLLDLSPLLPERVTGLSERQLARLPVTLGGRPIPVGELFAVRAGPEETLMLEGTDRHVRHIGRGAARGTIRVEGDAGDFLGRGLAGGRIVVSGSAGRHLAAGMRDGVVEVARDAGDFAASAPAGGRFGMQGGLVRVGGRLGDRAGDRMRRGVVVAAAAGDFTGAFMLGGTILLAGAPGRDTGFAMRRGSILCGDPRPLPATFVDCGPHDFLWTVLLERHLRASGIETATLPRRWRRWAGCASVGGKGEVLFACPH